MFVFRPFLTAIAKMNYLPYSWSGLMGSANPFIRYSRYPFMSLYNSLFILYLCLHFQALLKLNRKLQPMVDEIDANRKKWQDLCSSYQQTRRASVPNPSQKIEPTQDAETKSTETVKPSENIKFGPKSKSSQDLKCRVNTESCDGKAAASGGSTTPAAKQQQPTQ